MPPRQSEVKKVMIEITEALDKRQSFLNESFSSVHDRLNEINDRTIESQTQLKTLIGNGQPGKIGILEADVQILKTKTATIEKVASLEKDVDDLKDYRTKSRAYLAGAIGVFTFLGAAAHFFIELLFKPK